MSHDTDQQKNRGPLFWSDEKPERKRELSFFPLTWIQQARVTWVHWLRVLCSFLFQEITSIHIRFYLVHTPASRPCDSYNTYVLCIAIWPCPVDRGQSAAFSRRPQSLSSTTFLTTATAPATSATTTTTTSSHPTLCSHRHFCRPKAHPRSFLLHPLHMASFVPRSSNGPNNMRSRARIGGSDPLVARAAVVAYSIDTLLQYVLQETKIWKKVGPIHSRGTTSTFQQCTHFEINLTEHWGPLLFGKIGSQKL